jgi:hypothetical protein
LILPTAQFALSIGMSPLRGYKPSKPLDSLSMSLHARVSESDKHLHMSSLIAGWHFSFFNKGRSVHDLHIDAILDEQVV